MSQTFNQLINYSDDDLTFFSLVYQDYEATVECLKDLRTHYPNSRIVLRSDGDQDPRVPVLAQTYNLIFKL